MSLPENPRLKEILETALSSDRYAYDYTGAWRFIILTPEEHSELCKIVGVDNPAIKFTGKLSKKEEKEKK